MKCQVKGCGTEATVHLTEIINDTVKKLHLCEECAKKRGIEMEQHFGIADLLQGLAEFPQTPTQSVPQKTKCASCGMTYDDFKKIGRLGCAECYQAFESNLTPLLKRIHGSNQHTGKTLIQGPKLKTRARPKSAPPKETLEALRAKLKIAVAKEDYEEAARLRDKIREAEKQSQS